MPRAIEKPVLVTTAVRSPREEQAERQRRYLMTMALRVLCIVAAMVFAALDLRWEAGVAVAGSLVLPWVAVVVANGGPRSEATNPSLYDHDRRQLEAGKR